MKPLSSLVMLPLAGALLLGACASSPKLMETGACAPGVTCRPLGGYALPKLLLGVKLSAGDSASDLTLDEANRPITPDYWIPISYYPSSSADDEITIEVERGYLKSVKAVADDKTDEVIAEMIKILDLPTGTGTPGASLATNKYDAYVDPLSQEDIARFNGEARRFGVCLESPSALLDKQSHELASRAWTSGTRAVWYRPTVTVPVRFHAGDCKGPVVRELALVAPGREVAPILLSRAAFVKSETEVTFASGQLEKIVVRKPSSDLAFATLPHQLLKALIGLPSDLIQLKIDTTGKDKALIDAQKAEAVARIDLLKKIAELRAAQGGGSTDAPTPSNNAPTP